jgi:hypothetical protein
MDVTFRIKIESGNDAFQDGNAREETVRILRRVAEQIEAGSDGGKCIDINGNSVGAFAYETADEG